MTEQLGSTGYWTGKDWGTFETRGGYRRNIDGRPCIHCEPIQHWLPCFVITFERWLAERKAGRIMPTTL